MLWPPSRVNNSYYGSPYIDLAQLRKYINNPFFNKSLKELIAIIGSDIESTSCVSLNDSNITVEEKLFFERFLSKKKYSIFDYSEFVNLSNTRILLYNDKDFSMSKSEDPSGFAKLIFSKKSNHPDKNINTFTTYFISKRVIENEDLTLKLIVNFIVTKISNFLYENHNIIFKRHCQYDYIELPFDDVTLISDLKFTIVYYDIIYTAIDRLIGLKYKDFKMVDDAIGSSGIYSSNKIKSRVKNEDAMMKIKEMVYNNAISLPREDAADNETFKEILDYILYS